MKQANLLRVIIGIVLCYLQQTALAQSKWQFGVYAGGNVSKLKPQELAENKSYPFNDTYKLTPSYNFGVNIDYSVSKKLFIESGLNIISKNSDAEKEEEIYSITKGSFDGLTYTSYYKYYYRKFDYKTLAFQIPLSLNYTVFQKKDFKFIAYVGILWENMSMPKIKVSNTSNWDKLPPSSIVEETALAEKTDRFFPKYQPTESSFTRSNIGSLYGFRCSYKKIGLDIGMNNPIRNYTSVQYKNTSTTFNIRYQIK